MSDPVRAALEDALTADAMLMGLTGDGAAHHLHAPRTATPPLLIFQKISGTPEWSFSGGPVKPQLWLVKGVARGHSASAAEAIDTRADAVLTDAALSITGQTHLYLRRESDVGPYDEPDGADNYIHVGGQYRLTTTPT